MNTSDKDHDLDIPGFLKRGAAAQSAVDVEVAAANRRIAEKAAKRSVDTPLSNIPSTPQDPSKSPKPRVLTDAQREQKNRRLRESRAAVKPGKGHSISTDQLMSGDLGFGRKAPGKVTPGSKAFGEAMAAMKAKPAKQATVESVKKAGDDALPKAGTKQAIIIKMLFRKNGASRKEVLKALDWPAINLLGLSKQYAKRYGYKASQSKDSGETRYFLAKK